MGYMTRVNVKRVKPKKLPKRSTLINKADDLWREIVKAGGKCEKCGSRDRQLHAHHIMGRSRQCLKWDLRNGICLCNRCHNADGMHSENALKVEKFLIWIKSYRADDWKYLEEKLKQPVETITLIKLIDIVKELKYALTQNYNSI